MHEQPRGVCFVISVGTAGLSCTKPAFSEKILVPMYYAFRLKEVVKLEILC
jgi:hypothetical protein